MKQKMNSYGVIMAGGGGTRFWPLSRQKTPKQLLNLSGNGLMINETIDRINEVIDPSNIFIVTNENQADKMRSCVADKMPVNNILKEPSSRNTAACIGYAAMEIIKKYGDGIMCVFPADHYIKNQKEFHRVLKKAMEVAEQEDKLVTIGIRPTFPSTGYGYINFAANQDSDVYLVNEFVEKPKFEVAKRYVESGEYAWNSGMFIWKASTILDNFKRFLPKVYQYLETIASAMGTEDEEKVIHSIYDMIPSVSIDYGIMERSDEVVVILGDFGWNDVGSWDNLGVLYDVDEDGNVIKGEQVNINTKNCISYAENRLIATIGVNNLIIVETGDAVLVCNKEQAQSVKDVVEQLKDRGWDKYLV
jgi:mannose-1-phosphate guanylyltransferase